MTQAPDNKTPTSEIDRLRSTFERLVTSLSSDVQPGHPIGTSDNIDDTFDALILHASHATQEEIDALPVLVNVAEGTSNAAPDEDEGDFGKEVRQGVKDFLNGMLAERDFGGRHGRRGCFPPGRPPCGGPFERHGPPPPVSSSDCFMSYSKLILISAKPPCERVSDSLLSSHLETYRLLFYLKGPFGRGRGPFGHPHMHGPHSRVSLLIPSHISLIAQF